METRFYSNEDKVSIIDNRRFVFWDIVKGAAILLVVFGHQLQHSAQGSSEDIFYDDIIFKIIYSFHMPLFMLISGYFFYSTVKRYDMKIIIVKRAQRLLIPIFSIWTLLYIIDSNVFLLFSFRTYFIGLTTYLWFLWAVFYLSIIVLYVNHIFKDSFIIYLLGFVLTFLLPEVLISARVMYMYPFFVGGYLLNKYQFFDLYLFKYPWTSIIVCSVIYFILLVPFNRETYIYVSGFQVTGGGNFL